MLRMKGIGEDGELRRLSCGGYEICGESKKVITERGEGESPSAHRLRKGQMRRAPRASLKAVF